MQTRLWATAMLLLAGAVVVLTAGAAALDASHEETAEAINASAEATTDGPLPMGEDVQSALMTALPWLLGLLAVPMGIVGVYGTVRFAGSAASSRRRR